MLPEEINGNVDIDLAERPQIFVEMSQNANGELLEREIL